ncbi:acyl carrier protein (plasmid) [Streptomyces sp. NBC_01260]|uniref:acyl carrier protein n=1 Tax=unclassified Streptomyces TaxID=2593676 RepID=UPI000F47A6E3|nr:MULTISPECIES: acyl carrier protein [unclassified Streptomyces]MCX4775212.1 acyl carrier protein [Streptomyces sp. NBC_01285]ROQ65373.1 acyl carrier protein [Streptomyces sp. CEV 2-1]RPK32935.1 Acyl carrier protein [Streptomyces sp. ADI92-24]
MNDTDNALSRVRAIVAEILALGPDEIDDTADLFDHYQADSLNLIEIVAQVEKQFRTALPLDELPQARTIAALYGLVTRQAA